MDLLCPHCRNTLELTAPEPRQEIACPACGSSFRVEDGATIKEPEPEQQTIGRFQILMTLGQGAFGTVYKAFDPELHRTVAIKVPRAGELSGQKERDRFLREARSVAQLRHPSIVAVLEVGQASSFPFLVSDFIEGITLADLISAKTLTFHQTAEICAQVAEALQYAHDQGVVHRDVKPSNIMLEAVRRPSRPGSSDERQAALRSGVENGQMTPRLMDFGLAKREAGEATMTVEGQILGTPAYMSPEQARGEGHRVDGRSDVYSLGVILYQMLTGELPFRGNTRILLHQVLHNEPRPPRGLNKQIPLDLETICLKAMAKDPKQRYATAAALADDLRRFQRGDVIQARRVGMLGRSWRWCKRNRLVAGLMAVIALGMLVALGLGTVLLWLRQLEKGDEETLRAARHTIDQTLATPPDLSQLPPGELTSLRDLLATTIPLYERHIRRQPTDELLRDEYGLTCMRLAVLEFHHSGPEAALGPTNRARQIYAARAQEDPTNPAYRKALADCASNQAYLLQQLGRTAEAHEPIQEAIALYAALLAENSNAPEDRKLLGMQYDLLGGILESQRRTAEAVVAYRQAAEQQQPNVDAKPDSMGDVGALMRFRFNCGSALAALGRFAEADVEFNKGLHLSDNICRTSLEQVLALWLFRTPPAAAVNEFHLRLVGQAAANDGLRVVGQGLAYYQERSVTQPSSREYRRALAESQILLALVMLNHGRTEEEVESLLKAGLAGLDRLAADGGGETAPQVMIEASRYCSLLGTLMVSRKNTRRGEFWLDEAIKRAEAAALLVPRDLMLRQTFLETRLVLAGVHREAGRVSEALAEMDRIFALNLPLSRLQDLSWQVVFEAQRRMVLSEREGKVDECLNLARQLSGSQVATGVALYEAACILSRRSALLTDDRARDEQAALAVSTLRRAFQRGFRDGIQAAAAFRGEDPRSYMQKDTDFTPLRSRADYLQLVRDLNEGKTGDDGK